jgi:hypothetical protein
MVIRPPLSLKGLSSVEPTELFSMVVGDQHLFCFRGRAVSDQGERSFVIVLGSRLRGQLVPLSFFLPTTNHRVVSFGKEYSIAIDPMEKYIDQNGSRFYAFPGCLTLTKSGLFLQCVSETRGMSDLSYDLLTGDVPSDEVTRGPFCLFGKWSLVLHDSSIGKEGFAPTAVVSFAVDI